MAKGDNAILPLYDDADHLTASVASGSVSSGTFVKPSGGFQSGPLLNAASPSTDGGNFQAVTCTAGAKAVGVAAYDAPTAGDKFHVYAGPGLVVPMTAGASITAGNEVESDAAGKPIPLASGRSNGIALSSASNGATVYVRLHT